MTLCRQVEQLAHAYTRKGGKDNRRQQAARMMAFAAHAEALGAHEMGQVGGKHVVSYWRALRASGGLADATLYSHWLAIRELWRLAGKLGEPPRPFKTPRLLCAVDSAALHVDMPPAWRPAWATRPALPTCPHCGAALPTAALPSA